MADRYSIITHRTSVPYTYLQRQQLLLFKRVTTNQLSIENLQKRSICAETGTTNLSADPSVYLVSVLVHILE